MIPLRDSGVGKRYVTVPTGLHITVIRKTDDRVWIKRDGSKWEIWVSPDYQVEPGEVICREKATEGA